MYQLNTTYFILVITLIFTSSQLWAKSEIYKCVDKYGRASYSAKKDCENPTEMRVRQKTVNKNTSNDSDQVQNNSVRQCNKHRITLASYRKAVFLTKVEEDNSGKKVKVRLTREEKDKAIIDAQNDVNFWCKD